MADINVKHRVLAKVGDKSYDLRPSANPHAKLPKEVIKFLEDGNHLADSVIDSSAVASSDAARMQAEIDKLKTDLDAAQSELTTVKAELTKSKEDLSAAEAEIDKLKKPPVVK